MLADMGAQSQGRQYWRRAVTWARRPTRSPRLLAIGLLIEASPSLAAGLTFWAVLNALAPVLLVIATGHLVGAMPAALGHLRTIKAQHRLEIEATEVAALYVLIVVLGPLHDGLRAASKVELTFALQRRLINAVGTPIGIAHLEDADVLNRIAGAQGALTNYFPADAPVALAAVVSHQASGLLACAVLSEYWWWLGAGLAVLWLIIRRPLRTILLAYIKAYGGETSAMRRADYLSRVPTRSTDAKEVRVFGIGDWLVEQFRSQWHEGMQASWLALARYRRTVLLLGVVTAVTYGTGTWVVAHAALRRMISLGSFSALLPMLVVAANIGMMTMDDVQLEWMLAALPDLRDLESRLDIRSPSLSGAGNGAGPSHCVRFEGVAFAYPGTGSEVFTRLDLDIQAGKSTAIVGSNGAGKTTLVKLLCRLHDPTAGEIRVDGRPLANIGTESWRKNLSVVYQDFNRYPVSLADNIAFGCPAHIADTEGIERVALKAGLGPLIASLPSGVLTVLSSRYDGGVDLSGGQWQRVALARALFAVEHGAGVLVLDEPTAALDPRAEAVFYDRLLELAAGATVVLISHRFGTIRRADVIYVLEDGAVVERGTHGELVQRGGLYQRMFSMQAQHFREPTEAPETAFEDSATDSGSEQP